MSDGSENRISAPRALEREGASAGGPPGTGEGGGTPPSTSPTTQFVVRATRASRAFAFLLLALPLVSFACEDWPPGKRGDATNSSGSPSGAGTCSGTPLPCSALTTLQCGTTAGCVDQGSCTGTATTAGASCLTRSPTECNATPGCFWATVCTGTPYGTCSASTEESCLVAPGCLWTPAPTGTGGSGGSGTCQSYLVNCVSAASCDCGYTCVVRCPGCQGVCGDSCTSDSDCNGTMGLGFPTPYCQIGSGIGGASSGLCGPTR